MMQGSGASHLAGDDEVGRCVCHLHSQIPVREAWQGERSAALSGNLGAQTIAPRSDFDGERLAIVRASSVLQAQRASFRPG